MPALHSQRGRPQTPHELAVLDAQIAATDRQFDRLVYTLYRPTEEEIGVVGGLLPDVERGIDHEQETAGVVV